MPLFPAGRVHAQVGDREGNGFRRRVQRLHGGRAVLHPGRVSSVYDTLANTAGTVLGALAFAEPWYSIATKPLGEKREALVIPGAWGDAGLVLLAIWIIAQLNPALPFFGAGNIVASGLDMDDLRFLLSAAVAMGVWGFGLFVSVLLARDQGALRVTLALLSVALWLKFTAASLMLQPHFSEDWVSAGRIVGLVVGVLLLIPTRRFGRMGRTYLALVLILAGALSPRLPAPTARSTSSCGCSAGRTGSSPTSPRSRASCTSSGRSRRWATSSRSSCGVAR